MIAKLVIVSLTGLAMVSTQPRPAEETPLRIPETLLLSLGYAQIRAQESDMEELYCLIGHSDNGTTVVTGALFPAQVAWVVRDSVDNRIVEWHVKLVYPKDCPPGTVADFHTHPGRWRWSVALPSPIDVKEMSEDRYRLHLIGWMNEQGDAMISFYVYIGNGEYVVYDVDLITQY
jgi:hypothetical protein